VVRCVLVILLLLLVQPTLFSHGSNTQPAPGVIYEDPPLPPDTPRRPPPPPGAPGGGGGGGGGGKPNLHPPIRPTIRPGRRVSGSGSSWLIWWEMNREHLIGMRKILRRHGTTTGSGKNTVDPMAAKRAEVLVVLRKIARGNDKRTVRASAILALGRMGDEGDADYFMEVIGDSSQSYLVRDAAAIALGIVPIVEDKARVAVRNRLRFFMQVPRRLPKRTRGLVLLSSGLRGREDPALVMSILLRLGGGGRGLQANDAANVVYACGLSNDPMAAPELIPIVRNGRLGTNRAGELPRSHAALALGRCDERGSVPILVLAVTSRSAGVNTRRSAALALGRLLREADLESDRARMAERALLRIFEKGRDPVVRGFAALGLGGSKEPAGILELKTAIDHGGNADIKPYCALALGLAARTLGDRARALRTFLREEFSKTKERDLSAALALGLGIARDEAATDDLLDQLELRRLTARQRGGAAQALGLIRSNNPEVAKALEKVLREERNPELLGDAALALGLMGRRGVVSQLLDLLRTTKSSRVQGRICLSLGHLDAAGSVAPLLEILQDTKRRTLVREFAAVALGIMGDRREADPLFALDCYFNFLATTLATNEITRLY